MRLCLCWLCLCLRRRWTVESALSVSWKSLVNSPRSIILNFQRNNFPLKHGLYVFDRDEPQGKARIHLRVDEDGYGVLLVNAARMYQLNPSAACMTYMFLQKMSENEVVSNLARMYQIPVEQARTDYLSLTPSIESLIFPDSACPVCDLNLEISGSFSSKPSAPYRMDLALTYRCNNNCSHCYNARPRNFPELSTDKWKKVIDRCWEVGIPHIIFTGGEPTLRDDLSELVSYAQNLGQITGINTNGRRLADRDFVHHLVSFGLDHVQITLESAIPEEHDHLVCHPGAWKETVAGIRNALDSNLYVMTNTTLLRDNADHLEETLAFLHEIGVPTIGLNALIYSGRGETVGTGLNESLLPELLNKAQTLTTRYGQKLIWYTPTQYCHFDPMSLQLGIKGCTAALYNMCIEPDGSVIPCQSYYQSLGNLLSDSWSSIWNHPLSVILREHRDVPDACMDCTFLHECGGGCPLHRLESQPVPILPAIA